MLSLYWNTIRYLKPVQIMGRFWFKLYKPVWISKKPLTIRAAAQNWISISKTQKMLSNNKFRFLNHESIVDFASDWNSDIHSALWNYNLHYFDDLMANEASDRTEWHKNYIHSWILANPVGNGVGWDSYPTSLRITNWIKWSVNNEGNASYLNESLAQQSRWLSRRIEIHLQANHLWTNGKALVFAGAYFDDSEAKKWLNAGCKIISEQIQEQILEDGGHFELSPMYQALIIEDVLDLIQLDILYPDIISADLLKKLNSIVLPMFNWLRLMSHASEKLAHFNDTANGIAPTFTELSDYAANLGIEVTLSSVQTFQLAEDSGFARFEDAGAVIVCDVGSIGPDYQPGHSHADTLSFEMSLSGVQVFTNSGIDRYEYDKTRLFQRGTASHNTVEVDGVSSSEVWSSFRVAKRARPIELDYSVVERSATLSCAHDGYKRLPGRVKHCRKWAFSPGKLIVLDGLLGGCESATARFYVGPDVKVRKISNVECILELSGIEIKFKSNEGNIGIEESKYYPEFGRTLDNQCLIIDMAQKRSEVVVTWPVN